MKPESPASSPSISNVAEKPNLFLNILGSVLILGLGIFGLMFFGRSPEVPTDSSKLNAAGVAPLVETAPVVVWDKPFHLDIDGEASTYRVLTVGAEVTGRILQKSEFSRSGSFVNKGDLLFEIDPVNYQLEEQRLMARMTQAEEELKAIEVDIENTSRLLQLAKEDNDLQKDHLDRIRSLYNRKATSETELDNAARQELTARNAVQTQQNQLNTLTQTKKTKEAALKLAQAELERTRVDLQRCRITSPITGRIVDDVKEEGDYVKPGDELVHISDSSRMEVKCSLKADDLAWIWQHTQKMYPKPIQTSESAAAEGVDDGRKTDPFQIPNVPCEIAFEFEGVETIWDGMLARYEGTGMDRATRMFPCRVVVDNPEKTRVQSSGGETSVAPPTLLSGMYVTVRIPITSPITLLQVPSESIRPGEQLWVVRDGKLKIVPIQLVRVDGQTALVRQENSLLTSGDQVIVSPLASISDGMAIQTAADVKNISPDVPVKPVTNDANDRATNEGKETQR